MLRARGPTWFWQAPNRHSQELQQLLYLSCPSVPPSVRHSVAVSDGHVTSTSSLPTGLHVYGRERSPSLVRTPTCHAMQPYLAHLDRTWVLGPTCVSSTTMLNRIHAAPQRAMTACKQHLSTWRERMCSFSSHLRQSTCCQRHFNVTSLSHGPLPCEYIRVLQCHRGSCLQQARSPLL